MRRNTVINKIISGSLAVVFGLTSLGLPQYASAQVMPVPVSLPASVLTLTQPFTPVLLKGVKVDPVNPFQFDFIIDQGDSGLAGDSLQEESTKLIKYFLATLAIPESDLWVNLSPYEEDRVVPDDFGQTDMGRNLLAQDYMLKQLTASMLHPDGEHGKKFWKRIRQEAAEKYGTTKIPVNVFHKIWITPEHAEVREGDGVAFIFD